MCLLLLTSIAENSETNIAIHQKNSNIISTSPHKFSTETAYSIIERLPIVIQNEVIHNLPELYSPAPSFKLLARYTRHSDKTLFDDESPDDDFRLYYVTNKGTLIFPDYGPKHNRLLANNLQENRHTPYIFQEWRMILDTDRARTSLPYIPMMRRNKDDSTMIDVACLSLDEPSPAISNSQIICTIAKKNEIVMVNPSTILVKIDKTIGSEACLDRTFTLINKNTQCVVQDKIPYTLYRQFFAYHVALDPIKSAIVYKSCNKTGLFYQSIKGTHFTISIPDKFNKFYPESIQHIDQDIHIILKDGVQWTIIHIAYNLATQKSSLLNIWEPKSKLHYKMHMREQLITATEPSPRNTHKTSHEIIPFAHSCFSGATVEGLPMFPGKNTCPTAGIITSNNGKFHVANVTYGPNANNFTVMWQLTGVGLTPSCSYKTRLILHEFQKLYTHAKREHALCHLTPEQWFLYLTLFNNPACELPHHIWQYRFATPYDSEDKNHKSIALWRLQKIDMVLRKDSALYCIFAPKWLSLVESQGTTSARHT